MLSLTAPRMAVKLPPVHSYKKCSRVPIIRVNIVPIIFHFLNYPYVKKKRNMSRYFAGIRKAVQCDMSHFYMKILFIC